MKQQLYVVHMWSTGARVDKNVLAIDKQEAEKQVRRYVAEQFPGRRWDKVQVYDVEEEKVWLDLTKGSTEK